MAGAPFVRVHEALARHAARTGCQATTLGRMTFDLEHVSASRAHQMVLHDVDLRLPRNRLVGLIGPNGAGKSTLLSVMAGDLQPEKGQVSMDGICLGRCSPAALATRRAVMTQQSAAIFNLTVRQVLELGLYAFSYGSPEKTSRLLHAAAQDAGISAWLDESLTALSWGQQQRVHFARALLQAQAAWHESGQAWLLLDEPTASQDPWQQQAMFDACRRFIAWGEVGVVVVVHDLTLAAQWCDDLVLIKNGRVLAQGPSKEMLTVERLRQLFGEDLKVDVRWDPLPGVIIAR